MKSNFLRLCQWIRRGIPLPLAKTANKRSLIYIGNLADAIIHRLVEPKALNQTFFVSDDCDLSTHELIKKLALEMERPARILSLLSVLIKVVNTITRKRGNMAKLSESLQVDISKIRTVLAWEPPYYEVTTVEATVESMKMGRT